MTERFDIVGDGGRLKGAAETFETFPNDPVDCYKFIQEQRKNPDFKYKRAYFPLSQGEIRQHMSRLGLYRSTFKTDQGMPGNFSVFRIDPNKKQAEEAIFYSGEEGLAIPEPHANLTPDVVDRVQAAFLIMDLDTTHQLIEELPRREASKGRQPFFFIRAAVPKGDAVMSKETVDAIAEKTGDVVNAAIERAEKDAGEKVDANIIYLQPDAYVTADEAGKHSVAIEQVHAPDVGMFFKEIGEIKGSEMLPRAKEVMVSISTRFIATANEALKEFSEVYIVTRDEVVAEGSDVLEQGDMRVLAEGLKSAGKSVHMIGASSLANLASDNKAGVVLMNINYRDHATRNAIFDAYAKYPQLRFYPNPFVQQALQDMTGLKSITVPPERRAQFLQLIKGAPDLQKPVGITEKIRRVREMLEKAGIETDIVRVRFGGEVLVIPVQASQAWTAVATRIAQHTDNPEIKIDAVPLNSVNALVRGMRDETDGARMQVFRVGVVNSAL